MIFLQLMLIIIGELLFVENYIIDNITYDENVVISFGDDGTYEMEQQHTTDDYDFEKSQTNLYLGSSHSPEFKNTYIESNKKHNFKIYNSRKHGKMKRDADADSDEYTFRYQTEQVTEAAYDYDQLKSEYDHDLEELKKFRAKLNASEFTIAKKSKCKGFFNKGPMTMICLINEINSEDEKISNEAKESLRKLLLSWGIVFIVLFLVCWGHYGRCNWICPSKYCFPEDLYEESKQKLALNPPGSMTEMVAPKTDENSRAKFQKYYYEPSETEYYLYNSVWNDIYHAGMYDIPSQYQSSSGVRTILSIMICSPEMAWR